MRLYAPCLIAALTAAGLSSQATAETLSADNVIYTYGTDSLLSDPAVPAGYGYGETVFIEESTIVYPSDGGMYQTIDESVIVLEDPSGIAYESAEAGMATMTVDPVYGGRTSEVIDGVVYESVPATDAPMIESYAPVQTY